MKDNSKLIKEGIIVKLISFNTLLKNAELIPIARNFLTEENTYKMSNGLLVNIDDEEREDWNKEKTIVEMRTINSAPAVVTREIKPFGIIIWYPISWILKTIK